MAQAAPSLPRGRQHCLEMRGLGLVTHDRHLDILEADLLE